MSAVAILLAALVSFIAIEIFSCPTLNLKNSPTSHSNEKTTYGMIGEIVLEILSDTCSDKAKFISTKIHPEEIFKKKYLDSHGTGQSPLQEVSKCHFIECLDCTDIDCNGLIESVLEVEQYIHNDDQSDVDLCIKFQLGTSQHARRVIDIYQNGLFRRIKTKMKSHFFIGPIMKKVFILKNLSDLSSFISYCTDFGLDIFFCLQFYSMSFLETKGSSEPETFTVWQDWFEFYIPLAPFFRTFAILSICIIALSHTIMFLRAVSSQKLR